MFRFRLDKVLRHRRRQVDAAGRNLALATAVVVQAEARVAATAHEIDELVTSAAHERTVTIDPLRMRDQLAWRGRLELRRRAQENAVVAARGAREDARQQLVSAHRGQEVLENLEARQRAQWEQEERRADRRRLDEVGAVRAAWLSRQ